ncbi:NACHT domain-containing protein [Streptomyces sp. NPDC056468]|uniref:NACHT domain-containing protein n=1 Tax=Streptomyces sp. NPDC056468 TaxID=3345830 RepID=UPI0036C01F01
MNAKTRLTGLIYVLLALVGMGSALWLAFEHRSGVAETGVTLLPSLAGLYLAWAGFRADRADASMDRGLEEIADQLAVAVRSQWEDEARVRRLNDPYPLPVSWAPADPDLIESWAWLRATAAGWPGGPPSDPQTWASGPGELAGTDLEVVDVLMRRVPTRRLVILGSPGSGKTMLMVRLLLAMVEQRSPGGAVPVLFPLASWNPAAQGLNEWLVERLIQDYSSLRNPAPALNSMNRAQALVEHRLILPILDGLDELPPTSRTLALDAINQALPTRQALVLSSRVDEYRQAQSPVAGVPVRLAGAAGIELQPLAVAAAAGYLRRDAGGENSLTAARWEPVLTELGSDTPVGRALHTPLMLFLARTVYNPRPGEHSVNLPNPAELCDMDRLPTKVAVERHLFDAFIPAAYRSLPGATCPWSPQFAEQALVYLARHLQHTLLGIPDLAWWQLHQAVHRRAYQLLLATTTGLTAGFSVLGVGAGVGVGVGLAAGFLGWRTGGKPRQLPAVAFHWSGTGFARGLVRAVAFGLVLMLSARVDPVLGLLIGLFLGPLVGNWLGHKVVVLAGQETQSPDLASAADPETLLKWDRRVFWRLIIEFGFGYGIVLAFGMAALLDSATIVPVSVTVLLLIPAFGVCGASTYAASGHFTLTRCYLALHRKLPLDLMAFLADAHERGVLRQAGAVYQFRHIDLQHHLAQRVSAST